MYQAIGWAALRRWRGLRALRGRQNCRWATNVDIILVHGSYHGAWCWDLVLPELERRGHRVVAVNLPISDPTAGADRYADVVVDAMDSATEPAVVGHSMGGLVIPLVAARRPVSQLVFLAGFLQ